MPPATTDSETKKEEKKQQCTERKELAAESEARTAGELSKEEHEMKSSKEKLNQDSGSTRWSLGSALTSTEEKGKVATDFEAKEEKQQRAERRKFAKDSKAKTSKVLSK